MKKATKIIISALLPIMIYFAYTTIMTVRALILGHTSVDNAEKILQRLLDYSLTYRKIFWTYRDYANPSPLIEILFFLSIFVSIMFMLWRRELYNKLRVFKKRVISIKQNSKLERIKRLEQEINNLKNKSDK